MGMVFGEAAFDRRAPGLSPIADKISELSGLPVSVTESGSDVKGDLYDLHASLAFACAPEDQLKLYTYRAGAVKEFRDQTFGDADLPMVKFTQGLNEPAETQVVYLRSFIGQEPTLMAVTTLALEALGGRPRHPISAEVRQDYGTPITASQLEKRRRKVRKQATLGTAIVLLLLPVLIPLWFA